MSKLQVNSNKISEFPFFKKDNDNVQICIGYFLLELYHKNFFGYDGYIEKRKVRYEFQQYLKRNDLLEISKFQEKIGTLLQQNGLLMHTERGSDLYQIKMTKFREIYNNIVKQLDEAQIKASTTQILPPEFSFGETKENIEIHLNNDERTLQYQRGTQVRIKHDFHLTNMSCFICQENFSNEENFENHIEYHGEASGFKSISNYLLVSNPDIVLSYQTCTNNYLLRFTLKTNEMNLIIEKIIIVSSRWMNYARDDDVPFQISSNGIEYFFVDSHLFKIGIPRPIVIVYRHKDQTSIRKIAQYLFMRHDEFPIINMKLKSTRVISRAQMSKPKKKLPLYFPPDELKRLCANGDNVTDEEIGNLYPKIKQYIEDNKELRSSNIYEIYKILLQIEDIVVSNKYGKLNGKGCEIKGYCGEYSVTMTNLSPNINLSETLNPFDEIRLVVYKNVDNNNDESRGKNRNGRRRVKVIHGYVYRVYGKRVCFKPRDQYVGSIKLHEKYDVSFAPARIPIIYQFHALNLLTKKENLRKFLFPTINFNKRPSELSLEFYNKQVKINPEQRQAVMNITDGPNNAAPYIIFGPPGTGKTTTIVESIYQLWQRNKQNKILVTTGSNSACDEVARKLCEIFTKTDPEGLNLLRIYAAAAEKRIDNIDEDLLEASNLCHNYHFYPSVDSICLYRIVVATLTVVGKLVQGGLSENYFTHVFIDECAASTETEALVGIVGILSSNARLILSGDTKQLGPILQSQKAIDLGLDQSLMGRLLKRKCYETDQNGDYDRSIQTILVRNFRTHPDILKLSNLLYYEGKLEPHANSEITHWALGWHRLPRKNFPIIFNVVYGKTERDRQSTSLCNFKELSVVLDYIKNLMFFGINERKITENDIGVISPYKKQCNLIREELDKRGWYKIETGSVETFQGKEKPIIVISMVRSNVQSIGFLDNPKRLNVTLTRAQALMIIIGNPETLEKFHDWKEVIEYCKENSVLTGAKYPREPQIFNFKTSQSSLSTISNAQQQQNQKQKNNHRHRHQRNRNRTPSHVRENEMLDCISLSSNLEVKIDGWLKDTEKFREKYANDDIPSSTRSSVCGDFEIVNKANSSSADRFQFIKYEGIVPNERCRYPKGDLDSKIKNSIQKMSISVVNNPVKETVNTNHGGIFLPKTASNQLTNRVTLPQNPIKSSTIVRPMSVSGSNSIDQGTSSSHVNQTTRTMTTTVITSTSNRPHQISSNSQNSSRFPTTGRTMPTGSSNIHNPVVLQSRYYLSTPNHDTQRITSNQKEQNTKKDSKKSCLIS